ncbi:MAG: hypothetical protein MI755_11095, partial [Sphingomonadales bacterium]|nr:hypothetical protein [Sphingomonadales bacterium]
GMEDAQVERLPIVGVMGSGDREFPPYDEALGAWLAGWPVHLLTGAGRGVMTAVSRGFAQVQDRSGRVVGIVPSQPHPMGETPVPKPGYPNPWIEIPIRTHLPTHRSADHGLTSRNHINVLSSQAVIILPGSEGTLHEISLCVAYGAPAIYYQPVDALAPPWPLPQEISVATDFDALAEFLKGRNITAQ